MTRVSIDYVGLRMSNRIVTRIRRDWLLLFLSEHNFCFYVKKETCYPIKK